MTDDLQRASAESAAGSAEVERRSAERRNEDRRKLERISVRGLVGILIAALAAVLAIVAVWRQAGINTRVEALQQQQQSSSQSVAAFQVELQRLDAQTRQNAERAQELTRLAEQYAQLAESVQSLNERAQSGQRAVLKDEARFLLDIGARRLSLERDLTGTIAAFQAADERLALVNDSKLLPVRRRLAVEIQTLRSFEQPNLPAIAARLAAAEELAADLPVLGAVTASYEPEDRTSGLAPGFARAWQVVKSSMRDIISVRRIGEDAVELVSLEEQGVRRHHLQLLLFSARLAALRGDEVGFRASVGNARHWLDRMFDAADPRVRAQERELAQLYELKIASPLPEIGGALQLMVRLEPRVTAPVPPAAAVER